MKSLQLLNIEVIQDDLLRNATHLCSQSDLGKIYFADDNSIFCLDVKTREVSLCSNLESTTEVNRLDVTSMDYIIETQSICISSMKGDIIVYSPTSNEAECVGSVSSGLHSVAWSPDQEFLILLTGDNTLILMTKEFDPIVEKYLHPIEFGENTPINVGWGSKETQFQGSVGKDAAKVKKVIPKPALPWDDNRHRISWRGDGQCFVTSVIDPQEGCRKLRIWSREAVLLCTNEITDGLEHTLCWKPSGNLIASSQQIANRHKIIFFEKNGLSHGEFKLPFQPNTFVINELLWNPDSTVLAMWGHEGSETSKQFCVMLWTVNNYHWYLKQRLNFSSQDPEVLTICWDQNNLQMLHILCKGGRYYQYTWNSTVFHSLTKMEQNGVVTVIDGDDILVTAFGKMIMPPPMATYSFKLPAVANGICFAQYEENAADFMVALTNGEIVFFKKVLDADVNGTNNSENSNVNVPAGGDGRFKKPVQFLSFSGVYSLKYEDVTAVNVSNVFPYHWLWLHRDELLCVMPQANNSCCDLLSIKLPEKLDEQGCLTFEKLAMTDEKITRICARDGGSDIAVVLEDGRVMKYKDGQLEPWVCHWGKELILPPSCTSIAMCNIHGQEVILALSDRMQLFCNRTLLVSRCTSFHIHGEFLLITTCDNNLQCYFKSSATDAKNGQYFVTAAKATQPVEKGSRIVRAIPGRTEVVLQTPRGNLEVVHPRLLVLSLICQLLDDLKYGEVFKLMKRHRIDMNLLPDHNPQKFLNNIGLVIDQLGSSIAVNLFLASLTHEDVSNSMYQMVYNVKPRCDVTSLGLDKVNIICRALSNAIEEKNDPKLFQALVSCHAKKNPPELDRALLKIKQMKGSQVNGTSEKIVDDALKTLLYLVDASELYNEALGTYDAEIVIMVAEKSQKDPKEYIPFLNELKNMEENYRKYKIDMYLHRYKRALLYISKCGNHFDECLDLIRSHRLYKDALHLFPFSSDYFKAVWRSYGDYLMEKKYYDDAGLAYTKSGDYEKALSAYHLSLNYQLWLWVLNRLNYPALKTIVLCKEMAEKLKQNHNYVEAAVLLESYVEDIEESIITLIEGQEWSCAVRLMVKYSRTDIIETHLNSALKEHYESLSDSLAQMEVDFSAHNQKLKIFRAEKQRCASTWNEFPAHRDDDLFSDTSSVSNLSTSSGTGKQVSGSLITAKSGRSRRKQELKKYRLKEGSPNEDLAHIAILADIIMKVDKMKDNFRNTLQALVMFDFDIKANDLQRKMLSLCGIIESELPNIWQPEEISQQTTNYGPTSTVNSIIADMQSKTGSLHKKKDCGIPRPEWRTRMKLSLAVLQ